MHRITVKRKRRKGLKMLIYTLVVIGLAIVGSMLLKAHFKPQEDLYPQDVLGVPVHTQLVPEGDPGRPGILRKIKYVVLHETGNFAKGADAKAHSSYMLGGNKDSTSWHYTVDDTCVYHHIPDTEVAWHAGDGKTRNGGNMCGIGVEICVNEDGDFESAFDNAARLTAYLVKAYGLSVVDIRQHGDFISKNCPQRIRDDGRMDEFKTLVEEYMNML